MKTATVRARIAPELKYDSEQVLFSLGLSVSDAIEMFLIQVKLNRGIPFEVRIPNDVTLKTFEDTDKGKNITRHKSAKTMFEKLGR